MDKFELVRFTDNGFELDVLADLQHDTVWLSLNDLCALFDKDKSVISRHISNIFFEKELMKSQTVAKNATVQIEGTKKVERITNYYNLSR